MKRVLIGAILLTVGCEAADRVTAVGETDLSKAEKFAVLLPDLRTVVPTHLQLVNS